MHEALPVFLALALLNMIVGTAAGTAVTGATIFLIARVLYVGVYMAGVPVVRTLVWAVGWVGLVMMIIPLLDRSEPKRKAPGLYGPEASLPLATLG